MSNARIAEYQERSRKARNEPNFWWKKAGRRRDKEILKNAKKQRLQKEADELRRRIEQLRIQGVKI